jgi:hypothetical protein
MKNLKGLTCTGISQVAGGNMCGGRSNKVTNNCSYYCRRKLIFVIFERNSIFLGKENPLKKCTVVYS